MISDLARLGESVLSSNKSSQHLTARLTISASQSILLFFSDVTSPGCQDIIISPWSVYFPSIMLIICYCRNNDRLNRLFIIIQHAKNLFLYDRFKFYSNNSGSCQIFAKENKTNNYEVPTMSGLLLTAW